MLALLSSLWFGFFLSFVFPLEWTEGVVQSLVAIMEVICVSLLMVSYLIMKYVSGSPIWIPVTYYDFIECAKGNDALKIAVILVKSFLSVAIAFMLFIVINKFIFI
jgi:hypothetical protein